MKLTEDQLKTITASAGGYSAAEYKAVFDRIVQSGQAEGKIELEFPKVKPAHVAFVLRGLLKSTNNKTWMVAKTKDYGIVLKKI